jgi:hypothetical protein
VSGNSWFSLYRSNHGGRLTTDKSTRALKERNVETEVTPQNILTRKLKFCCLTKGILNFLNGQRIFGANIDITMSGTNRIACNDHSLYYRMGITFQNGSIHKSAGIALITIADQIFRLSFCMTADIPFLPSRKTRTAQTPQFRPLDLFYNLLGFHLKSF